MTEATGHPTSASVAKYIASVSKIAAAPTARRS
jgi:hypothetical protein